MVKLTEREISLVSLALSHLLSNLDDACDARAVLNEAGVSEDEIWLDGHAICRPLESEIVRIMEKW